MITVTVSYPNTPGSKFDWDYYMGTHVPLVQSELGAALIGASVDEGIAGGAPGEPATYTAIARLHFESVDAFQAAFGPVAEKVLGDIPNYTDVSPVIQISNAKI
jgi:uncharacterized protein (TIGR02118 family)